MATPSLPLIPFECTLITHVYSMFYPRSKCVNNVFTAFKRTFYPKSRGAKGGGVFWVWGRNK